ncbi:MAG TPA: hypothetical protein VMM92_00750 [Thermoanaerobaculia bacterium]|nr:hypothetical protein [Thermoanaerobaculia bacterium]
MPRTRSEAIEDLRMVIGCAFDIGSATSAPGPARSSSGPAKARSGNDLGRHWASS